LVIGGAELKEPVLKLHTGFSVSSSTMLASTPEVRRGISSSLSWFPPDHLSKFVDGNDPMPPKLVKNRIIARVPFSNSATGRFGSLDRASLDFLR
jgi:hypothetical protein